MNPNQAPTVQTEDLIEIARRAGKAALAYHGQSIEVALKEDRSPVTAADRAAHDLICAALQALTPNIKIVSEEDDNHRDSSIEPGESFWLVDPLDGTKEFLKQDSGAFTVNIALITAEIPRQAVVHAPALGLTYASDDRHSWKLADDGSRQNLSVRRANPQSLKMVASKDHQGPTVRQMIEGLPGCELVSMGSSLKFCLVAEGVADLYPRDIPTMEWDTAAAQSILERAGGQVLDQALRPLRYGKPTYRNGPLLAIGDPTLDWRQLLGPKHFR